MKKDFLITTLLFLLFIPAAFAKSETYIVNIPSSNGSFMPLEVKESDGRYFGPIGEAYSQFPSVEQLQINYAGYTLQQIEQAKHDPGLLNQMAMEQARRSSEAGELRRKAQQAREVQMALEEQKRKEESSIPTPAEKKKLKQDNAIKKSFMGILLLLGIAYIVFYILPRAAKAYENQLDDENNISIVDAIRIGVTQANFNARNSGLLAGEMLFILVVLNIYYHSFLVLGISLLVSLFLMVNPLTSMIISYIFSIFWMLVAGEFGFIACGGRWETMGNYVSAWVGGFVFATLAMWISLSAHRVSLQYLRDIRR